MTRQEERHESPGFFVPPSIVISDDRRMSDIYVPEGPALEGRQTPVPFSGVPADEEKAAVRGTASLDNLQAVGESLPETPAGSATSSHTATLELLSIPAAAAALPIAATATTRFPDSPISPNNGKRGSTTPEKSSSSSTSIENPTKKANDRSKTPSENGIGSPAASSSAGSSPTPQEAYAEARVQIQIEDKWKNPLLSPLLRYILSCSHGKNFIELLTRTDVSFIIPHGNSVLRVDNTTNEIQRTHPQLPLDEDLPIKVPLTEGLFTLMKQGTDCSCSFPKWTNLPEVTTFSPALLYVQIHPLSNLSLLYALKQKILLTWIQSHKKASFTNALEI